MTAVITADTLVTPRIAVVVPTYREVENIPRLVERVRAVRDSAGLDLDLLFADDDSRDGSAELVDGLGLAWVRLVTRTGDRGSSDAVLEGLRRAGGDVLAVMDADLSHPPEALPGMLARLVEGADFVVGSRFVEGGTADDRGLLRRLESRVARLLAYPLTRISDPMSGFFMLRRSAFDSREDYDPIGHTIGLELLVRCECERVVEVPIHVSDRRYGKSKRSLREHLRRVRHMRRLYIHKFAFASQLVQFLVVGTSGLVVNLALLTAFLAFGLDKTVAPIPAIGLSIVWNFSLNRRFSFSHARGGPVIRQLLGYVSACSVGAVVNYVVTVLLASRVGTLQLAAGVGVLAGTAFNFAASRLYVFKTTHVVPRG